MTATKFLDNTSEKGDLDIEREPPPDPRPKSRCPDGAWGWVIVLASFVCNAIVDGICFTFGVYVQRILDHYGADHSKSALVASLLVGFYLLAGPVVAALANRFGCRRVTIIGSILTCVALLIGTNSPSIEVVIVTIGIVGGIGLGLIYLPAIVIIGFWFERKRAFATGIALCGSGIGTLIFAWLNDKLLDEYDWKQSLVIIAGIVLHCAICGALFRPLEKASKHRMKRGVVTRGSIMKALIAEKERQRTISNGSLDNCIITKDNRLIKIDKIDLRNKSISYINRLKEQLGFSSRSLNKSKNSLFITSPIVKNNNSMILLVESNSRPVTPKAEKKEVAASPVRSKRRKRDYERRRDSGCGSLEGSPQNKSYDVLPQDDPLEAALRASEYGSQESSVSKKKTAAHPPEAEQLLDPSKVKVTSGGASGSFTSLAMERSSLRLSNNSNSLFPPSIMGNGSMMSTSVSVREIEEYEMDQRIPGWCSYISEMFDLSLFKEKAFVLYAFTSFFNMLGFFIPYFFVHDKVEVLFSDDQKRKEITTWIIAVMGLSNTVGRILAGWISDRPWANAVVINNVSQILAGIFTVILPFLDTEAHLYTFAVGFGFFTASFLALRSIVLVDLIGLERMTSSFGLLILFQGLAAVAGSPLAGWIMDQSGSIDSVFYLSGACLTLAGVVGFPLCRCMKSQDTCMYDDESDDFPMTSEAEMIEQRKLAQMDSLM